MNPVTGIASVLRLLKTTKTQNECSSCCHPLTPPACADFPWRHRSTVPLLTRLVSLPWPTDYRKAPKPERRPWKFYPTAWRGVDGLRSVLSHFERESFNLSLRFVFNPFILRESFTTIAIRFFQRLMRCGWSSLCPLILWENLLTTVCDSFLTLSLRESFTIICNSFLTLSLREYFTTTCDSFLTLSFWENLLPQLAIRF
jgi:hypothetical protein